MSEPLASKEPEAAYASREAFHVLEAVAKDFCGVYAAVVNSAGDSPRTSIQDATIALASQVLHLAMSVRRLVEDEFLLGAHVLNRPLLERVITIAYLTDFPEELSRWERGWSHKDAPSLGRMFDRLLGRKERTGGSISAAFLDPLNALVHGRPSSLHWNMVPNGADGQSITASYIKSRPDLCDDICLDVAILLMLTATHLRRHFPVVAKPSIPIQDYLAAIRLARAT